MYKLTAVISVQLLGEGEELVPVSRNAVSFLLHVSVREYLPKQFICGHVNCVWCWPLYNWVSEGQCRLK